MKCRKPFYGIHGCGQCLPCRINKRREWQTRIMLESFTHKESAFITLTYEKDPITLRPLDLRNFIRRFHYQHPIRYFAVGEYGEKTERPHYHAAIFGYRPSVSELESIWENGICHVGDLTPQSSSYIAGYVTKKMTNVNNYEVRKWLNGRHPEFARMSCRPCIGYEAIKIIADKTSEFVLDQQTLTIGSKQVPLGRTMKRKLKELTLNEETIKEMSLLRQEKRFAEEKASYESHSHPSLSWHELQKAIQKQLLLNDEHRLRHKPKKDRKL